MDDTWNSSHRVAHSRQVKKTAIESVFTLNLVGKGRYYIVGCLAHPALVNIGPVLAPSFYF